MGYGLRDGLWTGIFGTCEVDVYTVEVKLV